MTPCCHPILLFVIFGGSEGLQFVVTNKRLLFILSDYTDSHDTVLSSNYLLLSYLVVPIWQQKIQKSEDPVVWDYHVIFLWKNGLNTYVYDLDSCLPFSCKFEIYLKEAIKQDSLFQPEYYRYFRVVEAATYLRYFASNRKHMLDESGMWKSKPPPYPCIRTEETDDNIQEFINVDVSVGYGQVLNLKDFTKTFSQRLK
ncbi:NTAQ1 [Acanthosepion pharaonis]|uniref:Protein N-terminal glutamine amidohydrolase n=1 Tax=Acanthosepion pharaonis TaxID=158019 RepID=A0A812D9H7_ACAPH|nr:NTAQ1 [Sepia pharaonis]